MEMISLLKHTEKLPSEQSKQHLWHRFPTWYLYTCNYTSPQYISFGQNVTWVETLFLLCLRSFLQWQEMTLHLVMVHCGNVGFSYQYLCRLPQKQNHPPVSHCCPLLVHAHLPRPWRTDINWWNYSNIFICWQDGLQSSEFWSSGSEHHNVHSDYIIQQDIVLHKEDIRFQPWWKSTGVIINEGITHTDIELITVILMWCHNMLNCSSMTNALHG